MGEALVLPLPLLGLQPGRQRAAFCPLRIEATCDRRAWIRLASTTCSPDRPLAAAASPTAKGDAPTQSMVDAVGEPSGLAESPPGERSPISALRIKWRPSLASCTCRALNSLRAVPSSTVGSIIHRPKSSARCNAAASVPVCTFWSRSRAAVCKLRMRSGKATGGLAPCRRTAATMPETMAISIDLSPLASMLLNTSPATSCSSFSSPSSCGAWLRVP